MSGSPHLKPSSSPQAFLLFGLAGVLLAPQLGRSAEAMQTAAQVRGLSVQQAQRHDPVRLRGVVTFFDETLFSRFIQDETAGIYLRESTNTPWLLPGQWVEVEGTTSPGEYAPIVVPERVRVFGTAPLPSAKPVTFDQLASGKEDSQFVELDGIIRSVQFEEASQHHVIELATGGGRLPVYAKYLPALKLDELVGSTARVRGVCSTVFNRQRQLFAIRLMVPRLEDLTIEKPAGSDPFDIPTRNIGSLLQFTPEGSYGHRVKVRGTLIYQQPGTALYLQDGQQGLYVQTREKTPLTPGDRIEVLGFPAQGSYTPVLQDAIYRRIEGGTAPQPDRVDHDEALKGTYDCRLVRIEAKVLDRARASGEQFLVLSENDFIFHAYLEQPAGADAFAHLANGSQVGVTGVCLIEPGVWQAGENWRAKSFRLLLRSPGDVELLRAPSWWTFRKVLGIAGALGVVALAAFVWVVVLRRRVQKQTEIIRVQLQLEAALKERYEDLLENANDMVFTHDLSGKITSLNQTGERLLQHDRQSILAQNLIALMAEDQRSAAKQWLEQVLTGAEVPTAEWDFVNASGQRIKLEISSRLIEQAGHVVEIEGIARDITERRRLEREILEISNREQRRIGHDLHDGVCQQLAAITYLVDILGDQLQEKNAPEFAEAERIGNLLNEVNGQARNVARGLFPVRLEEHGLVLALEELAASAGRRYRITCRFVCEATPVQVDSEVELHLYYIVQEALLNAVNHGKATSVIVTLTAEVDRMKLTVQDNGAGFELPGKSRMGMGIRIMRHRAKVIGAALELQSQVGHGTQITCSFNPAARDTGRESKPA